MGRFNFDTSAAVWRHVYTGNKSTLTDQSRSHDGFFQPIDSDENVTALGIVGQAYQFVTEGSADIQASDQLVINSENYVVKGVRRNTMKRQDFLTCTLEKPTNEDD